MSYADLIPLPDLIATLTTGRPYSVMAEELGFADGSCLRRHCLRRGPRRIIYRGVVIIESLQEQ